MTKKPASSVALPQPSGFPEPHLVVNQEQGGQSPLVKTRPPPFQKARVLLEFLVPDPELLLVLRLRGHELRDVKSRDVATVRKPKHMEGEDRARFTLSARNVRMLFLTPSALTSHAAAASPSRLGETSRTA